MRPRLVCALALLLAGCAARSERGASVLERYQRLRAPLALTTQLSALLAGDATRLNARLRFADQKGARLGAVRMKRDALRLQNQTGQVAARLRRLIPTAADTTVSRYLRTVDHTLSYQWWEAHRLVQIASLVWRDPLFLDPQHERRLGALDAAARRSAQRAVRAAAYAAWWKAHHRNTFRYAAQRARRS